MNTMRSAALVLAAALAVAAPVATVGAQEAGTGVQELTAGTSGNTLTLSGTATFVDVPRQVGEDPSGDAAVAGVGADVTTMTIARPNPASNNVTFTFGVADAPPAANGTPQTLYVWPVSANGQDDSFYLEARHVSTLFPTSQNPTFKLMQDQPEGFADIATLTGVMDGTKVSFTVPLFRINAQGGSTIGQGGAGGGLGTTIGVPGALRFNGNLLGDSAFLDGPDYEVPEARVTFGLAPAGTPPSAVATSNAAVVTPSTGAFSANLNLSGMAPGEYVLVTKACYGSTNCGLASTDVTI